MDRLLAARSPRLRLGISIATVQRPGGRLGRSVATAAFGLVVALSATACSSGSATPTVSAGSDGGPIAVVATTSVFADMVAQVGGTRVLITSLVPKGGDVHTFEPKPADVQTIARAQLLVMNGLGLDDWLEKTIRNAAVGNTPLLKLAEGLTDVELVAGEDPGTPNPHLWMDLANGRRYVDEIAAGLARVDPAHAADYRSAATTYQARLAALDTSIRARIKTIPQADRKLVTFHDAFPYYARAYGITIVGTAVAAPGQDPTAAYTVELIREIKASGVKAIFSEAQFPTRLVDQLATETSAKVVADLYDDSVGDPPLDSYEAIIGWDTDQLVAALK